MLNYIMSTKYKGKKIEVCALNAFIALTRCVSTLSAKLERQTRGYELTSGQFGVLEALYHLGSLSQREIGKKILSSKGNITLIIDNLEKRDLVERLADPQDRRITNVRLTPKGKALIKKMMPEHVELITNYLSVLTEKEMEMLKLFCKRIGLSALKEQF